MNFNQHGFSLKCDYELRILREDDQDIDLIVPIDNKSINLYFDDMPGYIYDRIQCPMIKNIVIRLSKHKDNYLCTIHLLRNIDLHSSVLNFVFDYRNKELIIEDSDYAALLKILKLEVRCNE